MDYYIYLIRAGSTDYYKIGVTNNIEQRLKALQVSNHEVLECVAISNHMEIREAYINEAKIHTKYEKFRVHGEWFMFGYMPEVSGVIEKIKNATKNKIHKEIDVKNTDIFELLTTSEKYIKIPYIEKNGKNFRHYIRQKGTKEYIAKLEEKLGLTISQKNRVGGDVFYSPLIVRVAGKRGGIYLHSVLAVDFFQYLSIELSIFVSSTIFKISSSLNNCVLIDFIREIEEQLVKLGKPTHIYTSYEPYIHIIKKRIDKKMDCDKTIELQQHAHTFLKAGITDLKTLENMINNISL